MKKKMIQILPLGMQSNSGSLLVAMEKLGAHVRWIFPGDRIDVNEPIVIPGVGTFEGAMRFLEATGLREEVLRHGGKSSPLVGICLGFQTLHSQGLEGAAAKVNGLALFPGEVESLGKSQPKLNVGWRRVFDWESGLEENEYFYFCHSYYVRPGDSTQKASVFQDLEINAINIDGNVVGYQFHPELSGRNGLQKLARALKFD